MKRFVNYIFDEDDSFPAVVGLEIGGVRFGVVTATVRQMGLYSAKMREVREATARAVGMPAEEFEALKVWTPEMRTLSEAFSRWARVVGTTTVVQVCDRKKGLTLETAKWRDSSLVELKLDKPDGVLDLPAPLFDAWDAATVQVNEGIFETEKTPEQKKSGTISVT